MRMTVGDNAFLGYLVMYILIAVSYYFLSLAAKKIPIGVAYATWEGLGVPLITLVSVIVFKEHLNMQEIVGITLATAGIVLVNMGSSHA